jgi:hypothetical protein
MSINVNPAVNRELAIKVRDVVSHGLVCGLGIRKIGEFCVEAAVCFAMGLPHSDNPTCVSPAVRGWKIRVNDAQWSSKQARGNGMMKVAIAQLGSNTIDEVKFAKQVSLGTIQKVVPMALRAAAKVHPQVKHKEALESAAVHCEGAGDLSAGAYAAYAAADAAADAARAAAYAAADAGAYAAAAAAAYAARAAAYAAARAAAYAAADAGAYAAAAAAAARAGAAAARAGADADSVLKVACDVGLQALKDCGSPGCEYLDLVEDPSK